MPIVATPDHQPGSYPDTVRHVANGDPANQTFLGNAARDLEFRTDVLKDFANALEATVASSVNALDAFDKNHDHSGAQGEQVLAFAQIYANDNAVDAGFDLATAGVFRIRSSGGGSTLFRLLENGGTNKLKIQFPGSDALFDHQAAAASDRTINPHNLALAAQVHELSAGCLIDGATNGPYTEVTLNSAGAVNTLFAAPGLAGETPSDGVTAEGVLVGDLSSPGGYKVNLVVVRDNTGAVITGAGSNPVYGLLRNTGTELSPVWKLSFFAGGAAHSFGTDTTICLYGNKAYSLSTLPVVDTRFQLLAQKNVAL